MKNAFIKLTRYFTIISILLLGLSFMLGALGLRFNITDSVPKGFYWKLNKSWSKGEYVTFCPMQNPIVNLGKERGYIRSGSCLGDYTHMIKRVAAVKGDHVMINSKGVWINGKIWANSQPRSADKFKRPLSRYNTTSFTLKNSYTLLMGETLSSFDSRYFGPVPNTQIQGVMIPLLTWK